MAMNKYLRQMMREDEDIVCACAEHARGPGWANRPLWVIVRTRGTNEMRGLCLQPQEQPADRSWDGLFNVSAEVNRWIVGLLQA